MAVAVKPGLVSTTQATPVSLAVSSIIGGVFVLGSVAAIAYGVPKAWSTTIGPALAFNSFLNMAGLLAALAVATAAIAKLAVGLLGTRPLHGLRAGSAFVAGGLLLSFFLAVGTGNILKYAVFKGVDTSPIGLGVVGFVFIGLIVWGWSWMQTPSYVQTMETVEDQGWFIGKPYKPAQAQRMRRGTLLGILILVASGIYALVSRNSLPAAEWMVNVPFFGKSITLLPQARFTVPLLLTLLGLWLSYRAVNMPTFAEFLIATESEMNKVTWATRKSLIQDTIVVLATVFLFTSFLLVVDVAWYYILSNRYVNVLQVDAAGKKTDQSNKPATQQDW